jgi:hypothetical protein
MTGSATSLSAERWFPAIVSGGQTGVDRAALDFAVAHDLTYSGWVPLGGWAEDLPHPPGLLDLYPNLQEAPSTDTTVRTRLNMLYADATVTIFADNNHAVSRGTHTGLRVVQAARKPSLLIRLDDGAARQRVAAFLSGLGPTKHVAFGGPRESESPGIYDATVAFLEECWERVPA